MTWKNFKDELPELNIPFILCSFREFMPENFAVDMEVKQICRPKDISHHLTSEEPKVYSEFFTSCNDIERYQTGEYFWQYFPEIPKTDKYITVNKYKTKT